ncbi:type II toxin-antitoxin system HipA family toxin [Leucobacter sp. VD1]|uniref:type II toxin-antitoxin system HipA family toxin n=1 Tax=Leucobacter sp. VD1 TaxID=3080381 RepID=UPI00301AD713
MTFTQTQVLTVRAWGEVVGAVAAGTGRAYTFEYDPKWVRTGTPLSPILMKPTTRRRLFTFPGLNPDTFQNLPPMLADAAPDRFGNGIIDAVLAREGILPSQVTPLDRLAYVGSRAMGALTFTPDTSPSIVPTALEMNSLVEAARAAVQGNLSDEGVATESLAELIQVGTSAGGARAKAVIAWNRETGEIRAGGIEAPEGFEQWLLKFDGVGEDSQLGRGQNYGRTEYAYFLMARAAGIQMADSELLEEGGRAHFVTRRFDRPGTAGERLHMQSLCGLAALDFNQVETHDYASLFTVAQELGANSGEQREELFRRMVFNVLASNNDDHTKNHAFLMDRQGMWSPSPAYDITFAYNPASPWTRKHLMSVNGSFENITRNDLHAVGEKFMVPGYRGLVREVEEVVSAWPDFAAAAELPKERTKEVQERLDEVRL